MNNKCILVSNVTKMYNKKKVLQDISFSLEKGSIVGLLGPNGSGKTTILKLFLYIIRPQEGTIFINGKKVDYETRKYISFMPDREFLYDTMSVEDAIHYYQDMFSDFITKKAYKLAKKLQVPLKEDISKLSKGTREKLILLLTLSRKVPIYLLDEPLGSLDPVVKREMLEVIKETSTKDNIILISTHLLKDTEEILEEVLFLKDGHIQFQDKKENIIKMGKTIEEKYIEEFGHV